MPNVITIRIKNNNTCLQMPLGCSLTDVYKESGLQLEYGPIAAYVNNKSQGLNYRFYNSKDVQFLTLHDDSGMHTYVRSLFLVLSKAVEDVFPGGGYIMDGAVSQGFYCRLRIGRPVKD